jgi:hypothetical protein
MQNPENKDGGDSEAAREAFEAEFLAYYEERRSAGTSKESARRDVAAKYGVSVNRVYNLTRKRADRELDAIKAEEGRGFSWRTWKDSVLRIKG